MKNRMFIGIPILPIIITICLESKPPSDMRKNICNSLVLSENLFSYFPGSQRVELSREFRYIC